ncbi:helix-turn-helix domain-containing protein [Escherichia coli]
MDVACSVVLIRYPIDIFFEKEKVSLDAGSVMLVARNIRGLFCAYADRVKMADISNSVVNQYLERECELTEYTPTKMPLYLMSDIYNTELAEALITQHSESSDTLKDFSVITAFSCISLFATDRRLPLFLSGAVNNISCKVRAIIQTDISAGWMLGVIALQLHMSESLLKRKLKDEGYSFSRLLLEERMRVAVNLVCFQRECGQAIAEKCGYSSKSYFISVFHQYYGAPPESYAYLQKADVI